MRSSLKDEAKRAWALVIAVIVGLVSWPILALWLPVQMLSSAYWNGGSLWGSWILVMVCAGTGIPSLVIALITYAVLVSIWAVNENGSMAPTYAQIEKQRPARSASVTHAESIRDIITGLSDGTSLERLQLRIENIGPDAAAAVPPLVTILFDKLRPVSIRQRAATLLGKIGGASTVPPLIEALADEKLDVRTAAAYALVHIGSPSVHLLIEAMSDMRLREQVTFTLGEMAHWEVIDARDESSVFRALVPLLHDESAAVREESARALQWVVNKGKNIDRSIIIEALETQPAGDEYEGVRYHLARILESIGK